MKKLLHLAAPLRNVGDNALILGVHNLFKDFNLELQHLRSTVIDIKLINLINDKYDGLIIGGGGLLHAPKSIIDRKSDTTGTLIMTDVDNLKYLKKPLIIYGVGYNVFRGEQHLPDIAKKSINTLINNHHFSVRNDGSKERLAEYLDTDSSRILEIPDPGLYVTPVESTLSRSVSGDNNIAIQIAADRLNHRFKNKDEVARFVQNIKNFINSVSSEYTCWLVPHCPVDDDFIKLHFKGYKTVTLKLQLKEAREIMGFYSKMKVVIGQRGHGNICPFGINVPIISLVSHDKNLGFMKKIGFEKYAVDASDPVLSDKLISLVKDIDDNYKVNMRKSTLEMRTKSEKYITELSKII